jgi:hypothetical protein
MMRTFYQSRSRSTAALTQSLLDHLICCVLTQRVDSPDMIRLRPKREILPLDFCSPEVLDQRS